VYAFKFEGERFDTGNIHGYLDATVDFALKDPETREKFIQSLQYRMKKYGITL
jgi:UTP--glucose-1-phosphate uridylyltransferase